MNRRFGQDVGIMEKSRCTYRITSAELISSATKYGAGKNGASSRELANLKKKEKERKGKFSLGLWERIF